MAKKDKPLSQREQKLMERIQKDNAAYAAMSRMERRVHVSKEILLMIKKGTFVPGEGYGSVRLVRGKEPERVLLKDDQYGCTYEFPLGDLQPIVRAGGFECHGCAKAAVIVARAAVGNKVKVTRRSFDEYEGSAMKLANKVSHEVFGQAADIIECLYELWSRDSSAFPLLLDGVFKNDDDRISAYEDKRWELYSLGETERMVAIYRSIIDNGGYLVTGKYKY